MAKKTNLRGALREILNEAFSSEKNLVVWYDSDGAFETLITSVAPKDVEIIHFKGSYLAIRARIEEEFLKGDLDRKRLIYIPEKAPEPSWLRDYELFGVRLDLDLKAVLADKFKAKISEVRPILTPGNCKKLVRKWDEVLGNVEIPIKTLILKRALLATIFDQPHEFNLNKAIITYITHHDVISKELEKSNLEETFLELLNEQGYKYEDLDPKKIAATILLSEFAVNSGGLAEEELKAVLPRKDKRKFWSSLAQEWSLTLDSKQSFIKWSQVLEKEYGILEKVRGREGIENVMSFRAIDEALLEEVKARIGDKGLNGMLKNAPYIKKIIKKRSDSIWSKEELFEEWTGISKAIELIESIQSGLEEIERVEKSNLSFYAKRYIESWWQTDRAYRELSSLNLDIDPKIKTTFVDLAKEQYQIWLERLAIKFSLAFEESGKWEVEGAVNQRDFWATSIQPHREKVAVFLIDALRYELQKTLIAELEGEDFDVKHIPMLSSLPSITEIAMSSLLPHSKLGIQVSNGRVMAMLDDKIISTKLEREQFLKNKYGQKVAILNLDTLKKDSELKDKLKNVQLLVVMDREIDRAGSFIIEELLDNFDRLVNQVKRGVLLASQLGYNKAVIAADHGFLYLPFPEKNEVVEGVSQKPEIDLGRRYAIGKPPKIKGTIHLSLNILGYDANDLSAIFPFGIAFFAKPGREAFIHGGISPQECCLGIIECVKRKPIGEKVEVKVTLPNIISSAIFTVKLEPVMKKVSPIPREVIVELLIEDKPLVKSEVIEIFDRPKEITLKLPQIPKEVEIRVKDEDTEEILSSKKIPVSLEGYDELL